MHSLALTDTNGMYGLIQFAQLAKKANIKPILGVYLDDTNDPEINAVVLAKNRDGYSRICELITQRQLVESSKPKEFSGSRFSSVPTETGYRYWSGHIEKTEPLIQSCVFRNDKFSLAEALSSQNTEKLNDIIVITSSLKLLKQLKLRTLRQA